MPVLIYERVRTARYLRFFNRYKSKLLFAGNMNVLGILLIGLTGYWYLSGSRYNSFVYQGLMSLLATARLDDEMYKVTDWFQKKGRFIVYVTREIGK